MDPSRRQRRIVSLGRVRGRRHMTLARMQAALRLAAVSLACATAGHAQDATTAAVPKHQLQAKIDYCETCHGKAGQGFHGYYPIPRLAGQQPEYVENQLRAFIEHRRTSIIMFNVAHVLSPAMITALAADFHDLNPKPLGGASKELAPEGRKIYTEGIADSNVPACASCHGAEAKGDGQIPRLAGQLYDYIFRKLTNWSKERGQNPEKPDTSAIMEPIAHALTAPQIKAVASYVSYLE